MGFDFFSSEFLLNLVQVIFINIILSGDNAVVIALASRNLPKEQQKKAIMWGSLAAIGMRVILTLVAVYLLKIPLLQAVGGMLLIWIAVKLLVEDKAEECNYNADCMIAAIKTIVFADLIMSLDNVIAVAGATKGNIPLLLISLAISIPLIMWGSNMLMNLMEKFPIIVTLGACLLGYTAGEMIVSDVYVSNFLHTSMNFLHTLIPIITTIGVVVIGRILRGKKQDEVAPQ